MNAHLFAAPLYEKAVADGVPSAGTAVLAALLHSVPRELTSTEFRVVSPTKLARRPHSTRGTARTGLRLLEGSPYVHVRRVTGAKKKNWTFEVQLLTDAEALAVVR
ncbi:hypothetical protein [Microbacterium sp. LWO12-1.2]|uniref:hypothetical protein n=1 Tax=Microbacterium sp. LWO12-1.2 TaxID=3135261 RepID=UPI003439A5FA